jgi:ankyrin repeat protein
MPAEVPFRPVVHRGGCLSGRSFRWCTAVLGIALLALYLAPRAPSLLYRVQRSFRPPELSGTEHEELGIRDAGGKPQPLALYTAAMVADAHSAARVHDLLTRGASLKSRTTVGATALHAASAAGNMPALTALLAVADAADINAQDVHGRTPLIAAAMNGHAAAVEALIAVNADVTLRQRSDKMNALGKAARHGHLEAVRALIAADTPVDAIDCNGRSTLTYAAEEGRSELVQLLIKAGAIADEPEASNGITPIMVAAERGHLQMVELLADAGAKIDRATVWDKMTALGRAVQNYHLDVAAFLISKGADVNHAQQGSGQDGRTPLMIAVQRGNLEMTRALTTAGADVNAKDGWKHDKTSVLAMARDSQYRPNPEVENLLLSLGATE